MEINVKQERYSIETYLFIDFKWRLFSLRCRIFQWLLRVALFQLGIAAARYFFVASVDFPSEKQSILLQ
jgi:hypothetical protein